VTIFDLLFIAVFLATSLTLLVIVVAAIRGRSVQALHILKTLCIGLALYMGAVVVTSALLPRRLLNAGEPVCYDDWCIAVEGVSKQPSEKGITYNATLRLSSRARRVSQRENGIVVYLTDDRNNRYDPTPENAETPFNVMLQPQQSVTTTRSFATPVDAHVAGLVISHEGSGVPISWFIIGYESWFRKPTLVRVAS
jgi:hypothetical protein